MHEVGLVAFSILLQAAVGFSAIIYLQKGTILAGLDERGQKTVTLTIAATAGCGLLFATTHMAYPLNALYALTNYSSSWLSREVILAPAFITLVGLLFLQAHIKGRLSSGLLLLAVVLGLADVVSLANVYKASSILTWNSLHSFSIHVGGIVILGVLVTLTHPTTRTLLREIDVNRLLLVVLAVIAVRAVTQCVLASSLDARDIEQGILFPWDSVEVFGRTLPLLYSGWSLGALAAMLIGAKMCIQERSSRERMGAIELLLLIALCLHEIFIRVHFYTIHLE